MTSTIIAKIAVDFMVGGRCCDWSTWVNRKMREKFYMSWMINLNSKSNGQWFVDFLKIVNVTIYNLILSFALAGNGAPDIRWRFNFKFPFPQH